MAEVPSMERRRHKFEPPSGVVGPALAELFVRLRTAQGGPTGGELDKGLSGPEREIFEYGKSARKGVIETACVLIFAQWAIHRGAVRRLSRGVQVGYNVACAMGTFAYVQSRARTVGTEMFARIVTLPTDSALANEARVILGELEGPEGPYFAAVCSERGFAEDLYFAAGEGGDGSVHPQLRLEPRLGGRMARPTRRARSRGLGAATNDDDEDDDDRIIVRRNGGERASHMPQPPPWARGRREKKWAESQQVENQWGVERFESKEDDFVDVNDFDEPPATGAFDFASAARGVVDPVPDNPDDLEPTAGTAVDGLSPSQRRAHERRERRRIARERSESRW